MYIAELKNLKLIKQNDKEEGNYTTMESLNREKLIAEELIREHVRKRIAKKINQQKLLEDKIKKAVRIILETEAGTDEPSTYTGINVLADLLEKIIPIIQDDYKMLTTSEEQRDSFRNHIIQAVKNSLRPIEASTQAEKLPENFEFTITDSLFEDVKIKLSNTDDDTGDEVAGEFIDIDAPQEEEDFVQIDDQNETGRNFAQTTFKQIEKQIVDAYDMLADDKDQVLFYDYLITNLLLYFDKFEDELQVQLPSTTTPEYEESKSEEDQEDQEDSEELDQEEDLFS